MTQKRAKSMLKLLQPQIFLVCTLFSWIFHKVFAPALFYEIHGLFINAGGHGWRREPHGFYVLKKWVKIVCIFSHFVPVIVKSCYDG
jgi:hypothetical protein